MTILLLCFCSAILAGQDTDLKICDYCKEPIKMRYVEIDGKYYHPIHFKCAHCDRPIIDLKYYKKNDRYYCEKCFKEQFAPRCGYCGKVIEDNYIIVEDKAYHRDCYNNHVAIRCAVTGKQITGEYLFDFWGNNYSKYLESKIPRCDYCGRLISDVTTGGGATYTDGRHICNLCYPETVTDLKQARDLLNKVKAILANNGIIIDYDKIGLQLVDGNRLKKLSGNVNDNEMGFVEYEYSSYENVVIMKRLEVFILTGIPKMHFNSVVAHELMHVWQYLHGMLDNDPAFSEGSCNYASYLTLQTLTGKMSDYIIHNLENDPTADYGDGFRRVKKLVERRGINYWLDYLKNNKNFPPGF
jgi:hypothetical protein